MSSPLLAHRPVALPPRARITRARAARALATAASPANGTVEFDGGVGVALFRPPAPEPKPRPAVGKPGTAAFEKGRGVASFDG